MYSRFIKNITIFGQGKRNFRISLQMDLKNAQIIPANSYGARNLNPTHFFLNN